MNEASHESPKCPSIIDFVASSDSGWMTNRRMAGPRTSGPPAEDSTPRVVRMVITRCTGIACNRREMNWSQPSDIGSAHCTSSMPIITGSSPRVASSDNRL